VLLRPVALCVAAFSCGVCVCTCICVRVSLYVCVCVCVCVSGWCYRGCFPPIERTKKIYCEIQARVRNCPSVRTEVLEVYPVGAADAEELALDPATDLSVY
jgi:hypothetical protein